MIHLRSIATAIVVSTLVVSLAIVGGRFASADTPPGERERLASPPIDLKSVLRSVDRSLALLQQVGEEPAPGPHSPQRIVVHNTSFGEDVSKAVDGTIESFRQGRAQDTTDTERLALYAINVTTGEVVLVRDNPIGDLTYFGSPSWSADGRRILFDASPGKAFSKTRLKLFSVDQRKAEIKDLGPGNCPSLSPDGKRVTFLLNSGAGPDAPPGIWMMDIDGFNRRRVGGYGIPKWSPDGKQILTTSFRSPCRLSIIGVEERTVQLAEHRFYSTPSWAGDAGTIVAIVGWGGDAGIALIDVTDPEQARVKQIIWKKGDRVAVSPFYPVYSPRTDLCVFVGGDHRGEALYSIKPGQSDPPKRLEPTGYDGKIARLSFSPDGRYVVFCSDRFNQLAERGSTTASELTEPE